MVSASLAASPPALTAATTPVTATEPEPVTAEVAVKLWPLILLTILIAAGLGVVV